ncbi:MAG: hypothetical protein GX640_23220 [Fibrobacter sp.]|nr:hypothetical protein [Fibrobacter sp.]
MDERLQCEYPGGWERKLDRLAILGGHIACWCKKGFKNGMYVQPVLLLICGFAAVCAGILKKIKSRKYSLNTFEIKIDNS